MKKDVFNLYLILSWLGVCIFLFVRAKARHVDLTLLEVAIWFLYGYFGSIISYLLFEYKENGLQGLIHRMFLIQ